MKVILFGATGMVGQGVLRECLLDASVESVLAVGRSPTGQRHAKLREIMHDNFLDYSAIEPQLAGYDTCFFCLGVSSVGMSEQRYRHLIGPTLIREQDGGDVQAQTSFMVARVMHTGETTLFATGRYRDRIVLGAGRDGGAQFAEKIVILDSRLIDTLLAIPL